MTPPADLCHWTHALRVNGRSSRHDARLFVSGQLTSHEVYHLVAPAGLVAAVLARDVRRRGGPGLLLTLTRADMLVRLTVDDTTPDSRAGPPGPDATTGAHSSERSSLVDRPAGQGILALLCVDWGVTDRPGGVDGLWAVFDAHDRGRNGGPGPGPGPGPRTVATSRRAPRAKARGRPR